MQGLEELINLKILDIASNRITSLEGISTLTRLTDLWANDNLVTTMEQVEAALRPLRRTLDTVYFRGNPCSLDENYKLRMLYLLPNLQQLDDNPVRRS